MQKKEGKVNYALVIMRGRHFDAYTEPGLSQSAPPAVEWFKRHLAGQDSTRRDMPSRLSLGVEGMSFSGYYVSMA